MKNIILVTAMLMFSTALFAQATWEDNDPLGNFPTGFLGWDDVTNENLDILQNNTLRTRFTSVNWTGLNGLSTNNASRIHLGLDGNFQNPFSMLHMGTNINTNLQRPWMNVGLTMGASQDFMHLGILQRATPTSDNLQVDAVVAWGCNDDIFDPGKGPDNLRFLFLTPTAMSGMHPACLQDCTTMPCM